MGSTKPKLPKSQIWKLMPCPQAETLFYEIFHKEDGLGSLDSSKTKHSVILISDSERRRDQSLLKQLRWQNKRMKMIDDHRMARGPYLTQREEGISLYWARPDQQHQDYISYCETIMISLWNLTGGGGLQDFSRLAKLLSELLSELRVSVSLRDAKNNVLLATRGAKIWKGSFTRGSHGEMG
jgi:hypothetical protein